MGLERHKEYCLNTLPSAYNIPSSVTANAPGSIPPYLICVDHRVARVKSSLVELIVIHLSFRRSVAEHIFTKLTYLLELMNPVYAMHLFE